MINTKITAESFIDSKELREQVMERIEVLEKVKQLFLIPELECMTVKQVADYFEVPFKTIGSQYNYNKDEFDSDGVHLKRLDEFKSLVALNSSNLKMLQHRGFLELTLPDGTIVAINNKGVKCFPKRAILRMGMLLRDSRIAREIRTQLLNTFEHSNEEQRTVSINEEENLVGNIVRAALNGDMNTTVTSLTEYIGYKNRYIAEIEGHNKELIKKNEEVVSENKELAIENHTLAGDILKWTDRASANRLVKVLAGTCFHSDFQFAFNTIYKELMYKYGICVSSRKKRDNNRKPKIAYIRDDEWVYLFKVAAAICNQNHVSVKKLFEDAKIDISDLDLASDTEICPSKPSPTIVFGK